MMYKNVPLVRRWCRRMQRYQNVKYVRSILFTYEGAKEKLYIFIHYKYVWNVTLVKLKKENLTSFYYIIIYFYFLLHFFLCHGFLFFSLVHILYINICCYYSLYSSPFENRVLFTTQQILKLYVVIFLFFLFFRFHFSLLLIYRLIRNIRVFIILSKFYVIHF